MIFILEDLGDQSKKDLNIVGKFFLEIFEIHEEEMISSILEEIFFIF